MDLNLFRALTRADEATRVRVYDDATGKTLSKGDTIQGQPTIGIGRNVGRDGPGLRESEVEFMFTNDCDYYPEQAKVLPGWSSCNPVRQTVLACMVFNMGLSKVLKFRAMLDALQQSQYSRAADEMMDSVWASQVGARARRLSEMMRYGVPITR